MSCKDIVDEQECISNGCNWVPIHNVCNDGAVCANNTIKSTCLYQKCFWYDESCHCNPSPNPEQFADEQSCTEAGCFWYEGSCHSGVPSDCETLTTFGDCDNCPNCYWYNGACHNEPNPHPGNDAHMIIISPDYDNANIMANNIVHNTLIPYAQSLGLWTIHDMDGELADGEDVYPRMREFDPKGICEHGHGGTSHISGQHGMLWGLAVHMWEHMPLMAGKIVYLYSCHTGVLLGPAIVNNYGGKAYIGFTAETYIGTNNAYRDTLCEPWFALMEGDNVGTAVQRMIDMYNYWIDYLLAHGSSSTASNLIWNRDHLVTYGDQTAKLIEPEIEIVDDIFNFTINVT